MENEKERVCLDYEKNYNDLIKEFTKVKEQHKIELNAKDVFYNDVLDKKEEEIKWLKSIIDGLIRRF